MALAELLHTYQHHLSNSSLCFLEGVAYYGIPLRVAQIKEVNIL